MSDGNASGAVIEVKAIIAPAASGDDAASDSTKETQDDRDLLDFIVLGGL